ncbi:MltA [Novosphingobium aromaticivorans DSM 12444]|uniref:peptidoglycan lytic exotransglycosylase n=1 Tax=Novosphingobium aromaticivorans (strain ATCC 700278 / DSM 12444 / CCUG 56034 / CIP 105152 / NBRC 16084 / F199) TaxID=279238 RepID=Q2GAU3_NOVAD|nr:murein transglycosylase A [Novosphingobium aromaticivorans]ABD25030.1 MltA [Novosphingobium aromaticivorans DSM 12444]SCY87015.1 membrane-bound lytic murein transglycosylase A [Novosphingobium aromaticivorans]
MSGGQSTARSTTSVGLLLGLTLLGGCVRLVPESGGPRPVTPPSPPQAAKPATAALTGVTRGPIAAGLGFKPDNTAAALRSFVQSCPRLTKRTDNSGLTVPADWAPACAAAPGWPEGEAARFFSTYFETAEVGDGNAFVTGYFEPEIAGVRTRQPGYDIPVYAMPPDLVRARPGDAQPLPDGKMPLGRYDDAGVFVPYYDRGQIEDGALAEKGLEIAWAADPVELFFLQIQGSGRLRAPDGSVIRIGFAAQNGHPYSGIGSLMRERGLIGSQPGQYPGSMQGIQQYLRDYPEAGRALMRQNRSYVFFRELTGPGPVGALNVPISGRSTVAVDPAFVPLGAPVWLQLDRTEASGLWVAQDTGGAIQGANRFDSFWGAGAEARQVAGGMSARGRALLLLPKGTLERLNQR